MSRKYWSKIQSVDYVYYRFEMLHELGKSEKQQCRKIFTSLIDRQLIRRHPGRSKEISVFLLTFLIMAVPGFKQVKNEASEDEDPGASLST
jgi:hypothetical protein